MTVWKDRGRGMLETSTGKLGLLRVVLHRHLDFDDTVWLLTCTALGLQNIPLKAPGLPAARLEALDHAHRRLEILERHLSLLRSRTA